MKTTSEDPCSRGQAFKRAITIILNIWRERRIYDEALESFCCTMLSLVIILIRWALLILFPIGILLAYLAVRHEDAMAAKHKEARIANRKKMGTVARPVLVKQGADVLPNPAQITINDV